MLIIFFITNSIKIHIRKINFYRRNQRRSFYKGFFLEVSSEEIITHWPWGTAGDEKAEKAGKKGTTWTQSERDRAKFICRVLAFGPGRVFSSNLGIIEGALVICEIMEFVRPFGLGGHTASFSQLQMLSN